MILDKISVKQISNYNPKARKYICIVYKNHNQLTVSYTHPEKGAPFKAIGRLWLAKDYLGREGRLTSPGKA